MDINKLKILFDEKQIQERIKEIADELNKFYGQEEVIAVCVLKGAVMFAVDLVKHLKKLLLFVKCFLILFKIPFTAVIKTVPFYFIFCLNLTDNTRITGGFHPLLFHPDTPQRHLSITCHKIMHQQ